MKHKLSLKNKLMFGAAILISGSVAGMNSKIPSVPTVQTPNSANNDFGTEFVPEMEVFDQEDRIVFDEEFIHEMEMFELKGSKFGFYINLFGKNQINLQNHILSPKFEIASDLKIKQKSKGKYDPHGLMSESKEERRREEFDLHYLRSKAEDHFHFWKKIDDIVPTIVQYNLNEEKRDTKIEKSSSILFYFLKKCREKNPQLPILSRYTRRNYNAKLVYIFDNKEEILKTIDMWKIVPDKSIKNNHQILSTVLPKYKLEKETSVARKTPRLNDLKHLRAEAEIYLDFWKKIDDITPIILKRGLDSFLKDCWDNNKNLPPPRFYSNKNCCTKIKYLFDNRDEILKAVSKMGIVPNPMMENHHSIFRIVFPDHILEGSELIPVDTLDAVLNQIKQYVVIDPTIELDEIDRKLALDKAALVLRLKRNKSVLKNVSSFFPSFKQEDIVAFIERCREKNPHLPNLSIYQVREKVGALMYICDNTTSIYESMVILEPERVEEIIEFYGNADDILGRDFKKLARYLVEHDGKFPSFSERLKLK